MQLHLSNNDTPCLSYLLTYILAHILSTTTIIICIPNHSDNVVFLFLSSTFIIKINSYDTTV